MLQRGRKPVSELKFCWAGASDPRANGLWKIPMTSCSKRKEWIAGSTKLGRWRVMDKSQESNTQLIWTWNTTVTQKRHHSVYDKGKRTTGFSMAVLICSDPVGDNIAEDPIFPGIRRGVEEEFSYRICSAPLTARLRCPFPPACRREPYLPLFFSRLSSMATMPSITTPWAPHWISPSPKGQVCNPQ